MNRIATLCLSAFAMALSGAAFAAEKGDCSNESRYPEVTRQELASLVERKAAFVVDVNSSTSFKDAHVPGAVHYGTHQKDFASVLPKDKNALIVAYCGGPQCTAWKKAAEEACARGYTNIRHFKGGIQEWKKGA